ncbi:MAG: carboxypeptidase regulatory-like domain-containing protein [Isosphaeraceae bacterium]|nr:carboxypeptidase regulatory-like domain-containing protein [Isosphaeraceae bacterium]
MTRRNHRRTLRLESLENREVLSGPTADQAYMLELVNLARTNPAAAAEKFTSNLDANVTATIAYYNVDLNAVRNTIASSPVQPPLAWNDQIGQAAQGQSQYQASTGVQSHTGANGENLNQRLSDAGYGPTSSSGEDIYAYSTSPVEAMQAFLIDWGVASDGHRLNIQQPSVSPADAYKDAGVGIVTTNGSNIGPQIITVDFASKPNEQAQLIGLAYNDLNNDNFYEPGEGQAGVTVQATNLATGAQASTQTQDAGYYDLALAPGDYEVTATRNGQVISNQNVTINNVNVEVDYNLTQLAESGTPPAPAAQVMAAAVSTPSTPAPVTPPSNPAPVTPASNSTPTPTQTPAPQNTVVIPQQNTVTIPQSSSTPAVSSIFSKIFGSGTQFSLTSWGAGS